MTEELGFGDGLLERGGEGMRVVGEVHPGDEARALSGGGTDLGEALHDVGAGEPDGDCIDGGAVHAREIGEGELGPADIVEEIHGVRRDEGPGLGLEAIDHGGIELALGHRHSLP